MTDTTPDPQIDSVRTPCCPFCKSINTSVAFFPGPGIFRAECRDCLACGPQAHDRGTARAFWVDIKVLAVPAEWGIHPGFIERMAAELHLNEPTKGKWPDWRPTPTQLASELQHHVDKLKRALAHIESDDLALFDKEVVDATTPVLSPGDRDAMVELVAEFSADIASYGEAAWRLFGQEPKGGA